VGTIKREIDPGNVKRLYGIHPYRPVVLFTGRMSYQKGPDLLVEAAAKFLRKRNAQFVLIGDGDLRSHCEYQAQKLGIGNSCNFLGYAPDDTVINWFNACDLVCVPSRNEPFGIVVLEAWDAKKPVVASDAVALVDNFRTGVVARAEPSSIAWGLNYVLEGLGHNRMGEKGYDLLKKKYNWKTIAEKTLEVYEKVIEKQESRVGNLSTLRSHEFLPEMGYVWKKIDSHGTRRGGAPSSRACELCSHCKRQNQILLHYPANCQR
jgi:glycosyltransferase involved in cell wall biosynthesis